MNPENIAYPVRLLRRGSARRASDMPEARYVRKTMVTMKKLTGRPLCADPQ